MEILNKLSTLNPRTGRQGPIGGRFEQIGYQKESPSVRNSFSQQPMNFARGFRAAHRQSPQGRTRSCNVTDLWLDFLAIR